MTKKRDEEVPAGQELSDAELKDVAGGYELTNVLVSSYSVSASTDGSDVPTEQLSLNYARVPRRR